MIVKADINHNQLVVLFKLLEAGENHLLDDTFVQGSTSNTKGRRPFVRLYEIKGHPVVQKSRGEHFPAIPDRFSVTLETIPPGGLRTAIEHIRKILDAIESPAQ